MATIKCPSCLSTSLKKFGDIPPSNYFGGRELETILPGGSLIQCKVCNLFFRFPRLLDPYSEELYIEANPTHWQYNVGQRQDWIIAIDWLKEHCNKGKILDVGCWDGSFLAKLPEVYLKFGIEINENARTRAKDSGVNILGDNLYNHIEGHQNSFDVVTAFDIIEHVINPSEFLEYLLRLTKPNGYILIGTGNSSHWTQILAKSRYWYYWPPEHISFINETWLKFQQKLMQFEILSVKKFSHNSKPSIFGLIFQSLSNFIYLFLPFIFFHVRLLRYKIIGIPQRKIVDHPPTWDKSRDHILIVLQKEPETEKNDP